MFKKIGPGVLVAAAFIGPGTVTACTLAGASFGYALLWAMLLSVIATIVLQEMAARLGVITQRGLADVIKSELQITWVKYLVLGVILSAIVIGNAAYEGGNIGGATLGLEAIFGGENTKLYALIIGTIAFALLYFGNYKTLEKAFVSLVIIMSLSFLLTAIITKPDIVAIAKGLFVPSIPENSILSIIALVGTTVVPYNLFLHASLVSEKWKSKSDLKSARRDTIIAIALGGIVSMAIMIAATSISNNTISSVMDLAKGLEPLFGATAKYFMGVGLFAAGITSAITAPLAAAYVVNSIFGWKAGLDDKRFKAVWMSIIVIGLSFLIFGLKPIEIIKFAQIANGILLPVIAIFLLWVVNRKQVLGTYRNTLFQNILGVLIVVLTIILGIKSILKVFGY
ncbi:natural resistance-associated macrophage protein [Cellulophaga algicola DSM 14237]|uniref:Natural resistance-associated macrophage protein n=1 Tax=Cellulophaga algicola (strain DSM 14237 / IC166 / ACAM 630) TaxID=688270 RepID=E6X9U9_CELAD|nr:Nramp family divalent metal transporter [Cellulophaga algicola]ADV50910.1 natural resistance-associated macrophage protein [Cellulophaga algicola DSM 14237]